LERTTFNLKNPVVLGKVDRAARIAGLSKTAAVGAAMDYYLRMLGADDRYEKALALVDELNDSMTDQERSAIRAGLPYDEAGLPLW
jgi:antitoxin VapB